MIRHRLVIVRMYLLQHGVDGVVGACAMAGASAAGTPADGTNYVQYEIPYNNFILNEFRIFNSLYRSLNISFKNIGLMEFIFPMNTQATRFAAVSNIM